MTDEPKFTDTRPLHCRERTRDEGKGFSKTGCLACSATMANPIPCPHQGKRPLHYRVDERAEQP